MDIQLFRSLVTLALFILFIALWIWAFSKKRKPDFDAAARLPLSDDPPGQPDTTSKGEH